MQQAPCGCGLDPKPRPKPKTVSKPKPKAKTLAPAPINGCLGTQHGCCPYKTNNKRCGFQKTNTNGTNCLARQKCVPNKFCKCANTTPNGYYKLLYGRCPGTNYAKADPQGSNCPDIKPCSALQRKLGGC